jgi:hypothetical protein
MSTMFSSSHPASRRAARQVWGQTLGDLIRKIRVNDDRPLEEIAPLAALTVPEWKDIEAGQIPDTLEQVCLMAVALRLDRSWTALLGRLYAEAWEK